MKLAIVGSRGCMIENLEEYLPDGVTEILSGGAKGIDTCAKRYAIEHEIPLTEYLPQYHRYGRAAPIKRNDTIVEQAEFVLIFWDGRSKGTNYVIQQCKKKNKPFRVEMLA